MMHGSNCKAKTGMRFIQFVDKCCHDNTHCLADIYKGHTGIALLIFPSTHTMHIHVYTGTYQLCVYSAIPFYKYEHLPAASLQGEPILSPLILKKTREVDEMRERKERLPTGLVSAIYV